MFEIRDVRQIRILASPLRQAIVDALEASGPQSVAELGGILGYAPDALYHHLRLLSRGGLLRSEPRQASGGRQCAVFALRAKRTRLCYNPSDKQNRNAITAVAASMLRDASRAFAKAMTRAPVVRGRRRNLWTGRRTGWLTPSELEQLNELLHLMIRLMEQGKPRGRRTKLYALTFALAPFGTGRV